MKLCLVNPFSPGDCCITTIAIENLAHQYPYKLSVASACPDIFKFNPHIEHHFSPRKIPEDWVQKQVRYLDMSKSRTEPIRVTDSYLRYLEKELGIHIINRVKKPMIYLSEQEKAYKSMVHQHVTKVKTNYWVISPGWKNCYTVKAYPSNYWQHIVDKLAEFTTVVQIGSKTANNPKLKNVIDFSGQTDLRQLIRVIYSSSGGIGTISLLCHLCAAFDKPYILLNTGREPITWVSAYEHQVVLGAPEIHCAGCWKSRVVPLQDDSEKDDSLCLHPVTHLGDYPVARCMAFISPELVVEHVKRIEMIRNFYQ